MTLLPNLETVLNQINNFINIDAHRQIYTNNFDNLRNIIFDGLRKNEVFAYMFNGFQLAGKFNLISFVLVFSLEIYLFIVVFAKKNTNKFNGNFYYKK